MLSLKLIVEVVVIVLVVRAIVKALHAWASKKPSVENRYSPKQPEINEHDIVDGEFEDLRK